MIIIDSILTVKNLTFGYDEKVTIKDFSLNVYPGEIVCLEGSNGAGKTTILNCITGIVNSCQNIYIYNKPVFENRALIKKISYIMSEDCLYDYLTVAENIDFFKTVFECDEKYTENINHYLKLFNLDGYDSVLVKKLSQGMRNKLYLAIMLSRNFDLLVLDEPFTALDLSTQQIILDSVVDIVKSQNKAVLFVTHIETFKAIATRVVHIDKLEDEFFSNPE